MSLLECIHPLLEVDVVRRQLGLCHIARQLESLNVLLTISSYPVFSLAKLLFRVLESARRKRRDLRAEVTAMCIVSCRGWSNGGLVLRRSWPLRSAARTRGFCQSS